MSVLGATYGSLGVTVDAGRFIPDHFTFTPVVDAEFEPGCAAGLSSFTYAGQPFDFVATPSARVTAVAAGGTATRNYTDVALYNVNASGGALPQSPTSLPVERIRPHDLADSGTDVA